MRARDIFPCENFIARGERLRKSRLNHRTVVRKALIPAPKSSRFRSMFFRYPTFARCNSRAAIARLNFGNPDSVPRCRARQSGNRRAAYAGAFKSAMRGYPRQAPERKRKPCARKEKASSGAVRAVIQRCFPTSRNPMALRCTRRR